MGFFKNTKKNEINNAGMQRIGVAGSAHHSGATLTAILIATSLKSLGYKVALLEGFNFDPRKHSTITVYKNGQYCTYVLDKRTHQVLA